METPITNNLIVELHVPDFAPIKSFYSQLGFEIISEDEKSSNYPGYLVLSRKDPLGNSILNFYGDDDRVFNQSYFKKFPRDTMRGYAVEFTISTSDLDTLYAHVQKHLSANIMRGLQTLKDDNREWRDFRMADPYGYYLRFTDLLDWGQS
ncbi:MAG TPA: hypothetical protein VMR46_04090 [Candidatus Paceibacterota bacterium]|nr:hypothetical protein [Candidatus Paceibacterota bacterium]